MERFTEPRLNRLSDEFKLYGSLRQYKTDVEVKGAIQMKPNS